MWHPVPCTDQTADVAINKTALNHSVWPSIDILTGKTLQKRQTALFPLLILTLFVHNSTATVLRLKLALSQQYITTWHTIKTAFTYGYPDSSQHWEQTQVQNYTVLNQT